MKYRVLPHAQRDIEDIDDWVLENFGPVFAERTEARLYGTFALLADYPQMGIVSIDVSKRSVRFFCLKPYWIVYKPGATDRDSSRLPLRPRLGPHATNLTGRRRPESNATREATDLPLSPAPQYPSEALKNPFLPIGPGGILSP